MALKDLWGIYGVWLLVAASVLVEAQGPGALSEFNRAAPPANYLQGRSKEDPTEQVSVLFSQTCKVKTEPESHPRNNPEIQTLQVETDDRQQFLMLGEPTVTK